MDEIIYKEFIHQIKVYFNYDTLKQVYPNCILSKDHVTENGNTVSEYLNDLKIYVLNRNDNSLIGGDNYDIELLEDASFVYEKEYNFSTRRYFKIYD